MEWLVKDVWTGSYGEDDSMKYEEICSAKFIDRPNRFIARVELNGKEETVHVKNTGRCRELLLPGADVILSHSGNPARKTAYDLIADRKKLYEKE